jgi:hypothetical protein
MATGKPILDGLGGMLWGQDDGDANLLVSCCLFRLLVIRSHDVHHYML